MLNGKWMAESDVARILGCQRDQAYDKLLKIASKKGLLSMRIDTGNDDAQIILFPPSNKNQLFSLVSKLPKREYF
jgi:hypothetical protein